MAIAKKTLLEKNYPDIPIETDQDAKIEKHICILNRRYSVL